jgi:hypothetical protein
LPDDDTQKSALCPICDSPVETDAPKCPECKADLTVFGVKTGDDEASDVNIGEYEESLEKILGKIGEKDEDKEHELFDEIMAAVDKTGSLPEEEAAPEAATEEVVEEAQPSSVMFECPLCNTLVAEDATSCPGCGAIFAEPEGEAAAQEPVEEAVETQEEAAPVQETVEPEPEMAVAAEEPQEVYEEEPVAEPAPAVVEETPAKDKKRFRLGRKKREEAAAPDEVPRMPETARDERSLHRELTSCVSEVKPLLATARQYEINVLEGRKLIDQAITAGKKRDFERAINLVKQSKQTIEEVINHYISDSVQTTQVKISALSKAGGNVSDLEENMVTVQSLLGNRKLAEAVKIARSAADETEKAVMQYKSSLQKKEKSEKGKDVAVKLKVLIELIKSGEQVMVNVKGAKALLTQARLAIKKNELEGAEELLIKAKEDFLRELPKQLADIISSSKPVLYKAKMQGADIRPSIKLLKEASTSLKLNNYLDALEAIKQYKSEMSQYME